MPGEEEDYEGFARHFYDQDAHATPIFKLLKAFNLQQYSKVRSPYKTTRNFLRWAMKQKYTV